MCFHIFSPENITWALAWSPWFSHCRLFHQEPPFVPPKWYIFRLWSRKKLFLQITLLVQLPNLFLVPFIVVFASIGINFYTDAPYGSVSAGREKWPFNVLFFFKVEPPCGQTWWDSLISSILSSFSYVVDAENTLVGPVGPF